MNLLPWINWEAQWHLSTSKWSWWGSWLISTRCDSRSPMTSSVHAGPPVLGNSAYLSVHQKDKRSISEGFLGVDLHPLDSSLWLTLLTPPYWFQTWTVFWSWIHSHVYTSQHILVSPFVLLTWAQIAILWNAGWWEWLRPCGSTITPPSELCCSISVSWQALITLRQVFISVHTDTKCSCWNSRQVGI